MNAKIIYGDGNNRKNTKILPVADAFNFVKNTRGYLFYDIYFNGKLVYTTQGAAGYRYICDDCPYCKA